MTMTHKISDKALKKTRLRHNCTLEWANNYERMQASGFAYAMVPVLKDLYDNDEDVCKALERHLRFYNCHPGASAAIIGAVCALEEDYQTDTADSLKVALMGPMAGIGDTIQATLVQPLAYLFAAGLAAEGSYLALPVLVIPFIALWAIRFPLFDFGYKRSVAMIQDINGKASLGKFRELAQIVGLMVVGGFVPSMINVSLKYTYTKVINDVEQTVALQDTLDGILPCMLPIIVVGICFWMIKYKKIKPTTAIGLIAIVGFILGSVGII